MAQFYEMPQASPTMEVGVLLSWKKAEGDKLAPQDVIAEVETDKAAMDIEVFDPGYLLKILAAEGDEIPAGQPIAIIGAAADEDISALLAEWEQIKAGAAPRAAAPAGEDAAVEAPAAPEQAPAPSPAPAAPAALQAGIETFKWQGQEIDDAIMEPPEAFVVAGPVVRASPVARKVAAEKGVDLASVQGSGPHGRVVRADVEAHAQRPAAPAAAWEAVEDEVVRNSQMRKTIARRLTESYLGAPVFFLTATFDCDNLVAFREQLKGALEQKISYNDIVIKCVARALRDVPEVNASWGRDAITRHGRVDVGMAVALPDGLITPVIRDADRKPLAAIAAETRELAGRARERKLQPEEYTGGTFTVSNLGMMQIDHFTAIINPPEAGILAVGGMQQEPVVVGGQLAVGWRMRVTMTCDHRVVDGALGARFLQVVRRYIENPVLLAA
jgi:pyruvate dehydrogenase E2 component (dihydrolipoamide acetyltransferase)